MAYVRRLKSGWRVEIVRNGVRTSAVRPTKAEALAWGVAQEAVILSGEREAFPRKTLAEAVQRYRQEVVSKKEKTSPGVARADHLRFDAWLRDFPELAQKVFHEITTEDLARWRDARLRKVSESSVLRELQQFRPIWTLAINEWRWAGSSPWKALRLPRKGHARQRLAGWAEVRLLLRAAGYEAGRPPVTPMQEVGWAWLVALHTALRSGEVLRLSRSTVDLQRRVYRLERHKTEGAVGARLVPFTPRAARVLRVLDDAAKKAGRDAYFTISDASRDVLFRKLRDRLMIEELRFHDSRAAALTWLAKRYDVMTLAKISGHVDINELFNSYYRESAREVAARL